MYKKLLLTVPESKVLVELIDRISNQDNDFVDHNGVNLHIIKRHLLGLIPTENTNQLEIRG